MSLRAGFMELGLGKRSEIDAAEATTTSCPQVPHPQDGDLTPALGGSARAGKPHPKRNFPNIQPKHPLEQFEAVSSCSVPCSKPNSHLVSPSS